MPLFARPRLTLRRLLAALAVLLVGAGLFLYFTWPDDAASRDWAKHYDVSVGPPGLVPPGTVIGTGPPEGWSRLVVKSRPKIAPEERGKVYGFTAGKASIIFATFLADVGREDGPSPRHRLKAVAIGLGLTVNGRDMILSPDTLKQLAPDTDLIDREILKESYARQERARMPVRSPSFGLVDAPVPFRCGAKNRMVAFRYALLVDEPTGGLDVLVWWVDHENKCERSGPVVMHLLPVDLLNEPLLYVDPKELNILGVPSEVAFGVGRLPPAAAVFEPTPELADLALRPQFQPEEARRLEEALRRLVKDAAR